MACERVAIVGTAPTWRETPWNDPGLAITSLNDAYMIKGFGRWDVWFEQHPLDKLALRSEKLRAQPATPEEVPAGHYLRPEHHLQWLAQAAQTKPVILQSPPPPNWPMAQQYPLEAIQKRFAPILRMDPTWEKDYVCSGPSWMLMWAVAQGASRVEIYGIHLSTQQEWVYQRPQFEALCAYCLGKGIDIFIPKGSPLFKSGFTYCYEPRPSQACDLPKWRLSKVEHERRKVLDALMRRKPWTRTGPMRRQLVELDAQAKDLSAEISWHQMQGYLTSPEWRPS